MSVLDIAPVSMYSCMDRLNMFRCLIVISYRGSWFHMLIDRDVEWGVSFVICRVWFSAYRVGYSCVSRVKVKCALW